MRANIIVFSNVDVAYHGWGEATEKEEETEASCSS